MVLTPLSCFDVDADISHETHLEYRKEKKKHDCGRGNEKRGFTRVS